MVKATVPSYAGATNVQWGHQKRRFQNGEFDLLGLASAEYTRQPRAESNPWNSLPKNASSLAGARHAHVTQLLWQRRPISTSWHLPEPRVSARL